MKIREIYCKRWLLPKWVDGIVLYPFIFYKGHPTYGIIVHEHTHVKQIREHGVLKFYILWLYYTIRWGYHLNPFEMEAYSNQHSTPEK